MKPRIKQIAPPAVIALALGALSACSGGLQSLVPTETLQRAQTWRIAHHYDIRPPATPTLQATPEQRSLVESVRELALPQISLQYTDDGADIVVTLEPGFQQAGYGQVSGLFRRETIWWVRFFDHNGKKLGEFVERNQRLTTSANHLELSRKLAGDIATALSQP